jgi:hypothetical protein
LVLDASNTTLILLGACMLQHSVHFHIDWTSQPNSSASMKFDDK